MKIIHVFKSEMNNELYVCANDALAAFSKKHNKEIVVSSSLTIKPWQHICRFEFQVEQAADEFRKFLKTPDGVDFSRRYLFLNPLAELTKLRAVLPESCSFYVMGGLALDGHNGKLTRRHDDLDLMCWRKDVAIIKKALKRMGYGVREKYQSTNPRLVHTLETDEECPSIEVKIIDEQPGDCFQYHVNTPDQQIFPKKLLGPKQVTLEGVRFPAISLQLIADLNDVARKNLQRIKKENPKLYAVLGYKISNNTNDRKLIQALRNK